MHLQTATLLNPDQTRPQRQILVEMKGAESIRTIEREKYVTWGSSEPQVCASRVCYDQNQHEDRNNKPAAPTTTAGTHI